MMPTLITLYDVEKSVEQGIDGWLAYVTNVDEAYGFDGYKYSAPAVNSGTHAQHPHVVEFRCQS
jgi:hypothetical protein